MAAQPITTSLGNNVSEDTICNLTGPNDHPADNARMAPATDNGAYAYAAALLHDSPALDGGNDTACSPLDGRMQTRQGTHCDIGAFEAVRLGAPVVITTNALDVTDTHAHLQSSFNLRGESGTLYFKYGINPNGLINTTPTIATGPVGSRVLQGDRPRRARPQPDLLLRRGAGQRHRHDDRPDGAVHHFPLIRSAAGHADQRHRGDGHQRGAELPDRPAGLETTYTIDYGAGETPPVTIPANAGDQLYTRSITGLTPGTPYTVRVIATSSAGTSAPDGATTNLQTARRATGDAGAEVTIVDTGTNTSDDCPANAHVDWGDGSPAQDFDAAYITCVDAGGDNINYETRVKHTYETAGHYHVTIAYDSGDSGESYAQIGAPTPTPTPTATASPAPTVVPVPAQVAQTPTVRRRSPPRRPRSSTRRSSSSVRAPCSQAQGLLEVHPAAPGHRPLGIQIDATNGRVRLRRSRGRVAGRERRFLRRHLHHQPGRRVTELMLSGPAPTCGKTGQVLSGQEGQDTQPVGRRQGQLPHLGPYSAATIRGTRW